MAQLINGHDGIQCSLYLPALCFSCDACLVLHKGWLFPAYIHCASLTYHKHDLKYICIWTLKSIFLLFFLLFFWFVWDTGFFCFAESEQGAAPVSSVIPQGSLVNHLLFKIYLFSLGQPRRHKICFITSMLKVIIYTRKMYHARWNFD